MKSKTPLLKESNTYNYMSIYLAAIKADNHTYLESPPQPFLACHGEVLRDIRKR